MPVPNEPDRATLNRLQAGEMGALARIFQLYGLRVYRLCRRMMGSAADAEDTTQEIFLRVFEQAGKFGGRARFSTWLYRLAVRHCLNRIKQRDRRAAAEAAASEQAGRRHPPTGPTPFERQVAQDELATVDQLLTLLPPHYRACLVLREIDGLSYAQIAELLDLPTGTVMSRLARAREMLRGALPQSHEKPPADGNNPAGGVVQNTEE